MIAAIAGRRGDTTRWVGPRRIRSPFALTNAAEHRHEHHGVDQYFHRYPAASSLSEECRKLQEAANRAPRDRAQRRSAEACWLVQSRRLAVRRSRCSSLWRTRGRGPTASAESPPLAPRVRHSACDREDRAPSQPATDGGVPSPSSSHPCIARAHDVLRSNVRIVRALSNVGRMCDSTQSCARYTTYLSSWS
jgi:hypothetical protein